MTSEQSALHRMALSRERLRQALDDASTPPFESAARAALRPTAQRHPLGLMLGALLMGGLLVWSRPWRWLLGPALSAGWMPQLLLWAITQRPIRSWPSVVASPAQPRRSAAARPVATPP